MTDAADHQGDALSPCDREALDAIERKRAALFVVADAGREAIQEFVRHPQAVRAALDVFQFDAALDRVAAGRVRGTPRMGANEKA